MVLLRDAATTTLPTPISLKILKEIIRLRQTKILLYLYYMIKW